jgi:hypothetical protein
MLPIFTTSKIGKKKGREKEKYYRNKKTSQGTAVSVSCGWRLVGAVSTICRYSVDYNSGPVAKAIQNKLLPFFFFFFLFLAPWR